MSASVKLDCLLGQTTDIEAVVECASRIRIKINTDSSFEIHAPDPKHLQAFLIALAKAHAAMLSP